MTTVVIDARYVRDKPSGIGTVVSAMIARLPARAPDMSFVLLTHPSRPAPVRAPNVRCIVVPFVPDGPGTMLALGPWLRTKTSWDVFHNTFSALPHGIQGRTMVTLHDAMWLDDPWLVRSRGAWGQAETAFYQHGMRRAIERADALLVPSVATRDAAVKWSLDAARRTTITPWGLPDGCVVRDATPSTANGDRYVLVVGKSAPYKNHDNAVRAFARAFRDDARTSLVLVQRLGDGTDALMALAAKLDVAARVRAVPANTDGELAELYAGALALLHPSRCEGFGFPLVEAMAAGCPVVTADVTSMPEVGGDAALYARPDDPAALATHLRALADDEDLRRTMIERGHARARATTWDACIERTLAVYRG